MTATTVELAEHTLELLPARAVWWAEQATLLVADLHLGKAGLFRRAGLAIPEGDTADTLRRLSILIEQFTPERLVLLGDILHAAPGADGGLMRQLAAWRSRHAATPMLAIRGNHDRGIEPLAELFDWHLEGMPSAGLALRHHPPRDPGTATGPWLAGHWHPAVRLRGGGDSLRLPAFVEWPGQGLILPAFGSMTGAHTITARPGQRRYATSGERIIGLD